MISTYKPACTKAKNCFEADKDSGLCLQCYDNYYIDYKDGICKSNRENNEFQYCKSGREFCQNCIFNYYLGEDLKCTNTKGCVESVNGTCKICAEGYYLGLDNKCSLIENCIYSIDEYNCIECKDGYYYNETNKKCIIAINEFINCKQINRYDTKCSKCKDNYYLNRTDYLCYSNEQFGKFYKCSSTDSFGKYCASCVYNYYYGDKYHICSKFEGCEKLKDENNCIECQEYYCLDVKNGNCVNNDEIFDKEKKFYFRCNKTNEEGNACEICNNNLTLNDNGLCIDKIHCEKEVDGICQRCMSLEEDYYFYCLNSFFGCVETFEENCLECNNISDLYSCTKCDKGYQLNEYGMCEKKEEN